MDRFSVADGQLVLGDVVIGPATALYATPSELKSLTVKDGVVHTTATLNIDLVFVTDPYGTEPKVVGVELKRGSDLVSSHDTHRLARQLVTIGLTCDVVVLGISNALEVYVDFGSDMVAYQMMGVVIVNLPSSPKAVVKELASLKPILGGTRSVLRPFKWVDTDLRPKREKRGWLLQSIPGIGDKIAAKLLDKFGSAGVALTASDEQWAQLKVPRRVIESRREALQ